MVLTGSAPDEREMVAMGWLRGWMDSGRFSRFFSAWFSVHAHFLVLRFCYAVSTTVTQSFVNGNHGLVRISGLSLPRRCSDSHRSAHTFRSGMAKDTINITSCLAKPMPILFGVGITSASNTSLTFCPWKLLNLHQQPRHNSHPRRTWPPLSAATIPTPTPCTCPPSLPKSPQTQLPPLPAPLPQTAPERSPQGVPTKIKRKPTHFPCFGGLSDGGAPSPPRPSVAQNHWPQCADRGGKWNGERKAEGGWSS